MDSRGPVQKLQDDILVRIFATVIIIFGVQMWVQSLKKQTYHHQLHKVSVEYQKN